METNTFNPDMIPSALQRQAQFLIKHYHKRVKRISKAVGLLSILISGLIIPIPLFIHHFSLWQHTILGVCLVLTLAIFFHFLKRYEDDISDRFEQMMDVCEGSIFAADRLAAWLEQVVGERKKKKGERIASRAIEMNASEIDPLVDLGEGSNMYSTDRNSIELGESGVRKAMENNCMFVLVHGVENVVQNKVLYMFAAFMIAVGISVWGLGFIAVASFVVASACTITVAGVVFLGKNKVSTVCQLNALLPEIEAIRMEEQRLQQLKILEEKENVEKENVVEKHEENEKNHLFGIQLPFANPFQQRN